MTAVRVEVPSEIADELVERRLAVRPYASRGASSPDVITLVIVGLQTASAVVTLAANVVLYREISARVRQLADGRQVEIRAEGASEPVPELGVSSEDPIVDALAERCPPDGD